MQEFSSITASSYDADTLAPMLNDKSAEGWSVVSIVSAGSNIVAYLSREAGSGTDGGGTTDSHYPAAAPVSESHGDVADAADHAADAADDAVADSDTGTTVPPSGEAQYMPADPVPPVTSVADEPAGWGSAPESSTAPGSSTDGAPTGVADRVTDMATGGGDDAVSGAAAHAGAIGVTPAEPAPVADSAPSAAAPAAESTVPAGWYADPSGRYELRYWDGSAWTEHVSRSGQQFTDPPVA